MNILFRSDAVSRPPLCSNVANAQVKPTSAAIIHYGPEKHSCATIDPARVYLCDSGAQYLDGTTDTTRTVHFGKPGDAEKKAYTLVLKGLIGLDTAVFPKGTTGFALDCLARQHLWVCANYRASEENVS
jgi:Xaa-Pro aminopeptidase